MTLVSADFKDYIQNNNNYFESGNEADYLMLVIEILNTQTVDVNIHRLIDSGVCIYDDTYQFGTWMRQYKVLDRICLYKQKDDSHDISPMYRGKYAVVATLPNDVVNGQKPLSVTFKIGENEFTYHHRK